MKQLCNIASLYVAGACVVLAALAAPIDSLALSYFAPPEVGVILNGSTVWSGAVSAGSGTSAAEECAEKCLAWEKPAGTVYAGDREACIAFSLVHDSAAAPRAVGDEAATLADASGSVSSQTMCVLSTYGPKLEVVPSNGAADAYYSRILPRDDAPLTAAVRYNLEVPTSNVTLGPGVLLTSFAANIAFLLDHPTDDLLFYFRQRAGNPKPPGQCWGWDYGLHGSIAGLFMMGAGGAARWPQGAANGSLVQQLGDVVQGIADSAEADGYAMAFARNETWAHENPDYVTSWVTHGSLEAHVALPQSPALRTIRRHLSWFNNCTWLKQFLPPNDDPSDPPPGRDGWGAAPAGHQIYLIYQGIIHNTRIAASGVGTQQDIRIVSQLFQEDWWLRELAARNAHAVWQRTWFPHNYEVTAFEAYADMYALTGNQTYLDAVQGAWALFRESWIHVGGSMAINEAMFYPPGSYYLDYTYRQHNAELQRGVFGVRGDDPPPACAGPSHAAQHKAATEQGARHAHGHAHGLQETGHPTGEMCGSSFWIKLNQRFHRLFPDNETYVAEIERSIINVALAAQPPLSYGLGIRYFALLHKNKQLPTNHGTCCEGQGTRILGSLPEYIYSISSNGLYVDLYESSTIATEIGGVQVEVSIKASLGYSGSATVDVAVPGAEAPDGVTFELALRIPSWATGPVPVHVDGALAATGAPGSYAKLQRTWASGTSSVALDAGMGFRATNYTGLTQIDGMRRYAYEYGPTLLAATGRWDNVTDCTVIPDVDPTQPSAWMVPVSGQPLHFAVKGSPDIVYMPYFEIQDELFSVYAAFPIK